MPDTAAVLPETPRRRDARLDVFRGLALVMIFVNHVPGTVFSAFTTRGYGFSDAAEAFVLMSGIAAGLAYSSGFSATPGWPAVARVWGRAFTLYLVHLGTSVWAIAISGAAAIYFGVGAMVQTNHIDQLMASPVTVLVGLPLLTFHVAYFDILPLYIALLVAAPVALWLGQRRPLTLLGLSVLLWAAAGTLRLNLPSSPMPGGWFFNPVAWQVLFVIGLLTGTAMRQGHRLVARNRILFWTCAGFLVFALIWQRWEPFRNVAYQGVQFLEARGLPLTLVGFDKTYLSLPRLLHILALAYVLSCLPQVAAMARSVRLEPLAVMGRQALPTFAAGSILAIVMQSVRVGSPESLALDTLLIGGGLAAMYLVARLRQASLDATRGGRRGAGLHSGKAAPTIAATAPDPDPHEVPDAPLVLPSRR